jgi:hypothetical protein
MGKSKAEQQKAYRERKKESDPNFLLKEAQRVATYYVPSKDLTAKSNRRRRKLNTAHQKTYRNTIKNSIVTSKPGNELKGKKRISKELGKN